MKRSLIVILLAMLLFSCTTVEEVPVTPAAEPEAVLTENAPEKAVVTEHRKEESVKPNLKAERGKAVTEEPAVKEEPKAAEAPAPKAEEPKEEAQPQLTGKDLAAEISSRLEKEKTGGTEPEAGAPQEEEEAEVPAVPAVSDDTPEIPQKPAEGDAEVIPAPAEEAPAPAEGPEESTVTESAPVTVMEEPPVKTEAEKEAPEAEAESPAPVSQGPLDKEMSEPIFGLLVKLVIIIVLFTLAVVIRSKYRAKLPVPVSLILAILLTAVPMLTSTILEGWNSWQYSYLAILLTFFIFRQKDREVR